MELEMNIGTTTQAHLTAMDWKIVKIARHDGPRSLNPDAFLARLSRLLFGLGPPSPLANARLESLRRFCVRAWYWNRIRTKDIRAFLDAGYSLSDVFEILAYVAPRRGLRPSLEPLA
jgi:hypothetical protein